MKSALVTGGARRIGAAIATDLARNGFNVAIQYASSEDEAEGLADGLREYGVDTIALEADLLVADECVSLFQQCCESIGPVDLLVNNASIFQNDSVEEFNEDLFDRHFGIHVKAPSILIQQMAAQECITHGSVVNIIDQRVWRLNPNFYSYTLSKSALWTATQTLAQALAPRIRVNAIGPGPTLANERQSPEDFATQVSALPLKMQPSLEAFGETVRYLYDAKSVTGQMIALDGGQHLTWETPDVVGIKE
jgi:NAD(P)-dependent dehydrogenase (short-subunit alcohol dehydrogenase family)